MKEELDGNAAVTDFVPTKFLLLLPADNEQQERKDSPRDKKSRRPRRKTTKKSFADLTEQARL